MEEDLEEIRKRLKKYDQEQLLQEYEGMNQEKKEKLLEQISSIDFDLMQKLYDITKKEVEIQDTKIEPIKKLNKYKMPEEEYKKYEEVGIKSIINGDLAAVTMAGGQGTRLGHDGPKGTFDLGIESHKSLFEILCDSLKEANKTYNVIIPWYIMTSKENNKATIEFFEKNHYFDYPKEDVMFFVQGELPMLGTDGKILLNEDGFVKLAADGHGGIFEALLQKKVLEDMQKREIKWIFIGAVDNPLVKMVDPLLIGVTTVNKHLVGSKTLMKSHAKEKIGAFCKKNKKPYVIEYTELPDENAYETDENGELVYGEGHVLLNMFHIDILKEIGKNKLPYHVAFKKADYLDQNGNLVKPKKPNAYKFEAFLFDAFSILDDMTLLRVKREEEFAPVKNKEGEDSPETARKLYMNYMENRKKNQ